MTQRSKPRYPGDTLETGAVPELDRDRNILRTLERTLAYARRRDYRGPDFGDGMSSQLLQALPVDNKWLNLAVQEAVKRAPVNIRPLMLVDYRRNYKGTALFSMTNLNLLELQRTLDYPLDADVDYLAEASSLAEWLVDNCCTGYSGFCGGHQHKLQMLDGQGDPNDPDIVSTSYAVKALLAASEFNPAYAGIARTAEDFIVEDLNYRRAEGGALINYHLNHPEEYYTLNAGALGARTLIDLYAKFDDASLRERSTAILDYIAEKQLDVGGWTYRIPADASHLSMDNHHNGFIIECFQRYHDVTGTTRYESTLDRALEFYRETLYDADGAPAFDEKNDFPRDVHASAQGILVFTYAGDLDFARQIIKWTIENMSDGDGRFYFRKHRFHTKRVTLMRWCQAWMAYAMSEYLLARVSRT